MEAINFVAFIGLSFCCHWVGERYGHKVISHVPAHHRFAFITGLAAIVTHPPFWHGVKDYLIHLIVYSGAVIQNH